MIAPVRWRGSLGHVGFLLGGAERTDTVFGRCLAHPLSGLAFGRLQCWRRLWWRSSGTVSRLVRRAKAGERGGQRETDKSEYAFHDGLSARRILRRIPGVRRARATSARLNKELVQ
jgi:hypothetical protein